jgi:ribulose-5-phosphate 4-epimerase/fuculose-1-phosphate aldolase
MCTAASSLGDEAVARASGLGEGGHAAPAADPALIEELVVANRILFAHGVVDAFGHVGARHDKQTDRFLLARNMAPGLVTAADLLEFDLAGNPIAAGGRAVYLERFIHGEIFRARPDVNAVVHSHSPGVVPFGVASGVPLRPIWHMSGFIGAAAPLFEIRDVAGEGSDLLIRDSALGAALAASLGSASLVLMRGHGATVVGATLRQAVFRAVYAELNARLQLDAMRLGTVTYLTPAEAEATTQSVGGQIDRAWNLWRKQVGADIHTP